MGARASKPARTAASAAAARKFPSRAPGAAVPPAGPRPTARPSREARDPDAKASFTKNETIAADGHDPDPNPLTDPAFSERLRQMGVATPSPTLSNSSIASPAPGRGRGRGSGRNTTTTTTTTTTTPPNPAAPMYPAPSNNATLGVLAARAELQRRADAEFENPLVQTRRSGREFLDVGTLRQILNLRDAAAADPAEIERRLRLKEGVVRRLGAPGVLRPLAGAAA